MFIITIKILVRRGAYCRWKNFVKVELQETEMGVQKLSSSEMDKGSIKGRQQCQICLAGGL